MKMGMRHTCGAAYVALPQNGYHPISQMIDYILTESPTYITDYDGTHHLIRRVDWHELL